MKKFKLKHYRFYGNGQEVFYNSYSKKGSKENCDDLIQALRKRYGRYATIQNYDEYKKELKRYGNVYLTLEDDDE